MTEPAATQLDLLVDAITSAADALALPAPRRPWCEVLPDVVVLDRLADTDRGSVDAGRFVTIGLLDEPELQSQRPAIVDLEEGGGLLVFGAGGSGKTTLLRTVAASVSAVGGLDVAILAIDGASRGLTTLRHLPEVIDVATGDDLEAVTRHLAMLDAELRRRRRLLADADAEHLSAYRHTNGSGPARIVVLIDGLGDVVGTLMEAAASGTAAGADWIDRLQRIVVEGRQVGIHSVVAADRRQAVPSRIHAAISRRLILRLADDGSYAEHGIRPDRLRHLELGPGRGLLDGTTFVQVASVSDDPSARSQSRRIAHLAAAGGRPKTPLLRSAALPEHVHLDTVAPLEIEPCRAPGRGTRRTGGVGRCGVPLGLADLTGERVDVDLDGSNLVVCGPPRSGRSTALATLISCLRRCHEVVELIPVTGGSSVREPAGSRGRWDAIGRTLDRLTSAAIARSRSDCPTVLVVDDADALDHPSLGALWEQIVELPHLRLVVSLDSQSMIGYTTSALVLRARRARRLLVLRPDDPVEFLQMTGVALPTRPGLRHPPGRGVLLVDRVPTIVQVATSSPPPTGPR
jgi:S-DNA-T family DNA segregation ATPase FtsK/SpoIIIE